MPAILTITFNPCLDVNVSVAEMKPEIKMRCENMLIQPGGGGINVARAIHRLGGQAAALFPCGGARGQKLKTLLSAENVPYIAVNIHDDTRENLIVRDISTGQQYRLNMPGPAVDDRVFQALLSAVDGQPRLDYLVVSGSLAPGMKPEVFDELAAVACRHNARLIVDTSGDALKRALFCGPYLAKLSVHELAGLLGRRDLGSMEEIRNAAGRIVERGVAMVVVSLGADGAFWMMEGRHGVIPAPQVKTISTVGAGDSMVAGIIWSLALGRQFPEAVRYGVACGSAATMRPGTTLFDRKDVEVIVHQMKSNHVQII